MYKKLAELILERSSLQTKKNAIYNQLLECSISSDDAEPIINVVETYSTYLAVCERLVKVINAINNTNHIAKLPNGMTIIDGLTMRDNLSSVIESLEKIRNSIISVLNRTQTNMITGVVRKNVARLDINVLTKQIDDHTNERNKINAMIQATNWMIDVQIQD